MSNENHLSGKPYLTKYPSHVFATDINVFIFCLHHYLHCKKKKKKKAFQQCKNNVPGRQPWDVINIKKLITIMIILEFIFKDKG